MAGAASISAGTDARLAALAALEKTATQATRRTPRGCIGRN